VPLVPRPWPRDPVRHRERPWKTAGAGRRAQGGPPDRPAGAAARPPPSPRMQQGRRV